MLVFPFLIPGLNFLFPGTGREILNATGREGKFEAGIPGNHGKQEFPLTPVLDHCAVKGKMTMNIIK